MRHLYEAYGKLFTPGDTVTALLHSSHELPGVTPISVSWPTRRSASRLIYEQLVLPFAAKRIGYDVIHFPDYQAPVFVHVPRSIVTVHDLVAFRFPEFFPPQASAVKRMLLQRSVRIASRVVVPSEATRDDLQNVLEVPGEKIRVIPHGVRPRGSASEHPPHDRPYFLAVGTVEPRKNFSRLIAAYALLTRHRGDVPDLLIAGRLGWLYDEIVAAPGKEHVAGRVHFLHYVSDEQLSTLYHHAVALAYPSLYEGFGLPVIEAMSAGIPVVCSNRGALAEVGQDAVFGVEPDDVESIAEGLQRVLTDNTERAIRVNKGRQRAQTYNWHRAAQLTRQVFLEVEKEAKG